MFQFERVNNKRYPDAHLLEGTTRSTRLRVPYIRENSWNQAFVMPHVTQWTTESSISSCEIRSMNLIFLCTYSIHSFKCLYN